MLISKDAIYIVCEVEIKTSLLSQIVLENFVQKAKAGEMFGIHIAEIKLESVIYCLFYQHEQINEKTNVSIEKWTKETEYSNEDKI